MIIRENDPDKNPQRLVLNLNDIVRQGNTEKNIVLMPNDVVYIPPTILGFVGYKLKDLLFPVQPVAQIGQTYGYAQTGGLGFNPQRGGGSLGGGGSFGNIGQ